jgi:hypothetical protein
LEGSAVKFKISLYILVGNAKKFRTCFLEGSAEKFKTCLFFSQIKSDQRKRKAAKNVILMDKSDG